MMKKIKLQLALMCVLAFSFTSCYTYTYSVGNGAKGNSSVKKKNNYFINGLITGKISDPKSMANGAADYNVKIQHSFVDYLLTGITFGIYSPTTTTVTK